MPGSNSSNLIARNFTPFSLYRKILSTEVKAVSTANPPSDSANNAQLALNPFINLMDNKNGYGRNTILFTIFNASSLTNSDTIYTDTATCTVQLYQFDNYMKPTADGNNTVEPINLCTLVDEIADVQLGKLYSFDNLYASKYKLVITTSSASADLVVNTSWNDEAVHVNTGFVKSAYGDPRSILPPERYVLPTSANLIAKG